MAAKLAHIESCKELLVHNADINMRDYYLHTPLYNSITHITDQFYWIDKKHQKTAKHVIKQYTDTIILLLEHGARVNEKIIKSATKIVSRPEIVIIPGAQNIIQLLTDAQKKQQNLQNK